MRETGSWPDAPSSGLRTETRALAREVIVSCARRLWKATARTLGLRVPTAKIRIRRLG
jgi:hypothetical protein